MIRFKVISEDSSKNSPKKLKTMLQCGNTIECSSIIAGEGTFSKIPPEVVSAYGIKPYRHSSLVSNELYIYLTYLGADLMLVLNNHSHALVIDKDIEMLEGKEIIDEINNIIKSNKS